MAIVLQSGAESPVIGEKRPLFCERRLKKRATPTIMMNTTTRNRPAPVAPPMTTGLRLDVSRSVSPLSVVVTVLSDGVGTVVSGILLSESAVVP